MNAPVTTAVPLVQAQTSLRDVIAQVFRHRGLLLGCALLVGGLVAALVYLQPPSYTATATVLVERGKSPVMRTETTTLSVEMNEAIETEIQLLTSRTVAEGVVDRLRLHERPRRPSRVRDTIEKARETLTGWGLLEPAERRESTVRGFLSTFKAKHPPLTWMITMAYSAEDPSDAAAILRTTLDVYFDRRRAVYLNDTASFFAKRVEQIDGQLIERRGGLARTTEVAERGRYQLEIQALEASFLANRDRLDRALADAAADRSLFNVRVVDVPSVPTRMRFSRLLLISAGLVVGTMLGALLALTRDYFDHTVRTPEDVVRRLGLPVLGSLRDVGRLRQERLP